MTKNNDATNVHNQDQSAQTPTKKVNGKNLLIKYIVLLVVIAVVTPFLIYGNNHIVITEYSYTNSKMPSEMDGYCIVQISDLHNAKFGKDNSRLVEMIKSCNPNIIVLTGDFVDGGTHTNIQISLDFANQITQICPVYYVTGNHEYYLTEEKRTKLLDGLKAAGVIVLDDEAVELFAGANLVGIDDESLYHDFSSLIDTDDFNIVLAHEPQRIKNYSQYNADLVFSGHAHGGQFILPLFGPVYAPDQGLRPQYTSGIITYEDTDMIVSRGIGNSAFPFRINNYPEIVCVKFYN